MNVKFEVMDSPAISGMLDENGQSARTLGWAKFYKPHSVEAVVDVQCLPLFTILAAMDLPIVDFFSLDVEGAELGILETIPWHQVHIVLTKIVLTTVPNLSLSLSFIQKVDIRVLLVEYSHLDKKRLLDMMNGFGYDNPFNLREDMLFVKRGP